MRTSGLRRRTLLADFYGRALQSGRLGPAARPTLRQGRTASNLQARALTDLLTGAGDTPATVEDFTFEWPTTALATAAATRRTGLIVLRTVLGAYQGAAATLSETSYRVLFASLATSVAEQAGALALPGAAVDSFPVALDLEAAGAALERYLGSRRSREESSYAAARLARRRVAALGAPASVRPRHRR